MPTTAVAPALSKTMSKPEACEYLGKSKRTVETYVSTGRLKIGYVEGRNGKTAVFARADIEALKREIDTPSYRAVPAPTHIGEPLFSGRRELPEADGPAAGPMVSSVGDLVTALRTAQPLKPWLTLDEAAELSGLPARWLLGEARKNGDAARCVVAMNVGVDGGRASWRFSADALGIRK